jgi:hypothetical protein
MVNNNFQNFIIKITKTDWLIINSLSINGIKKQRPYCVKKKA